MRFLTAASCLVLVLLGLVALPRRAGGVAAGTAVRMDVPELARNADLIVEGRILSAVARPVDARIETEYLLAVDRTFAGEDRPLRVVRLPGGVLEDGRGLLLAGMPHLEAGETVLLFLTDPSPSGIQMPVGLAQGKFTLRERADGSRIAVRDGAGVTLLQRETGAVLHPEGRTLVDYADLVSQIEAARAAVR